MEEVEGINRRKEALLWREARNIGKEIEKEIISKRKRNNGKEEIHEIPKCAKKRRKLRKETLPDIQDKLEKVPNKGIVGIATIDLIDEEFDNIFGEIEAMQENKEFLKDTRYGLNEKESVLSKKEVDDSALKEYCTNVEEDKKDTIALFFRECCSLLKRPGTSLFLLSGSSNLAKFSLTCFLLASFCSINFLISL